MNGAVENFVPAPLPAVDPRRVAECDFQIGDRVVVTWSDAPQQEADIVGLAPLTIRREPRPEWEDQGEIRMVTADMLRRVIAPLTLASSDTPLG